MKFEHLKENSNVENDIRTLYSCRRGAVLEKYSHLGLDWSLQVEFDQSVLIWHIATDLCYHSDWRDQDAIASNGKLSNLPLQRELSCSTAETGGELLTHLWLLMAHFGLTEQFQISQGHARAKLVVK
ncbi:hypothetical protein CFP56_029855 [Quercus suber]|uniref:Uncharacterized protein n=1 Tax=Quercus suber TaxID=58331 RepID=A0AAW0JPG6_QUESU